jgi:hypothetical protein
MSDDHMIKATVVITGTEALEGLDEKFDTAINIALGDIEATLLKIVKGRTPKGIRYRKIERTKKGERYKGLRGKGRYVYSGEMAKQWTSELDGLVLTLTNEAPYADILEAGGYPNIGKPKTGILEGVETEISPRTKAEGGGIYSSQAVGGILEPLVTDQEFIDRITKTINREVARILG